MKSVLIVGEELANLDKAIDLSAPEVLNLIIREPIEIGGRSIFEGLLMGFF